MSVEIKNQSNHIDESHSHPKPMTYFKVAMALVILTSLEILVFYFDWLGYGIIPVLAFLSMYYMHLKFDSKLFTYVFMSGLILATVVILWLMALFGWFV